MTDVRTAAEAGERELIKLVSQWAHVGLQADGTFGIGDDCASIPASPGDPAASETAGADAAGETILTTDLLVEGTHFLRNAETDWRLVGYKAAAANLSDLAAAGSMPRALLVAVGVPPNFPATGLSELYRGMNHCAQIAKTRIIGGDTTRAAALTIAVTAIGWKAPGWAHCRRSDAAPGDTVYVTGELGASRAGLELLLHPGRRSEMPKPATDALIRRHFVPPARIDAGLCVARAGSRAAVIDISDGLFNEASLLAAASDVEIQINLDAIPIDKNAQTLCETLGHDPARFALFSGEEYELLFTSPLPPKQLHDEFRTAGVECQLNPLGTVNPGSGVLLLQGGIPVDLSDETFVHFR